MAANSDIVTARGRIRQLLQRSTSFKSTTFNSFSSLTRNQKSNNQSPKQAVSTKKFDIFLKVKKAIFIIENKRARLLTCTSIIAAIKSTSQYVVQPRSILIIWYIQRRVEFNLFKSIKYYHRHFGVEIRERIKLGLLSVRL